LVTIQTGVSALKAPKGVSPGLAANLAYSLSGTEGSNPSLSASFIRYSSGNSKASAGSIMSGAAEQFEGGCLCGAIRFTATGRPKGIYWCHCQSCRRHTGAPVSVFVAFEPNAYTVTKGEITKFDSTPGKTRRGFCTRCGSTLTCETLPRIKETHFHVGAFDQPTSLQPTRHYFSNERLPWLHTGDR